MYNHYLGAKISQLKCFWGGHNPSIGVPNATYVLENNVVLGY